VFAYLRAFACATDEKIDKQGKLKKVRTGTWGQSFQGARDGNAKVRSGGVPWVGFDGWRQVAWC
jgi:hypothetical protein